MSPDTQQSDLRKDDTFFGRTRELSRLVRNLQRGRHSLIVGDKGIGKSSLMLEAMEILSGKTKHIDISPGNIAAYGHPLDVPVNADQYNFLSIKNFVPIGACIKELSEQLFYSGDLRAGLRKVWPDWTSASKHLTRLGNVNAESVLFESISHSGKPCLIFIGSLDRIPPGQYKFLETLLTSSVICSGVTQIKESNATRRIWASFSRIELEPLPEHDCIRLIDYFFAKYPLHVIDAELYRREILKASNGNPFHIKNMLWHGYREKFVDINEIRNLRQLEEGRYFNMGPIYVFGVAMFTLLKIFSIGMDNKEFYIYFSALGFLAYVVFRVFRAFFLFRPQKHQ